MKKFFRICIAALTLFAAGEFVFAKDNGEVKAETLERPPVLRMTEDGYRVLWNAEGKSCGKLVLKDRHGNRKEIVPVRGKVNYKDSGYMADFNELVPGEKYSVKIPGYGKLTFFAPPEKGKSFTFAAISDHQTIEEITEQGFMAVAGEKPDCIVSAGDMLEDGKIKNWRKNFFEKISLLRGIPFACAEGNNDTGGGLFSSYFGLENRWYAAKYAGVTFIFLDSNMPLRSGSEQLEWLEKTLCEDSSDWKVVVYHHSSFNSTEPDWSFTKNREEITSLFEKYGVNLVINGHIHLYDRTKLINGVQYVTLPTMSGNFAKRVEVNENTSYYAKTIMGFRGYGLFTVDGNVIKAVVKDLDGNIMDEFEVQK